MTLISCRDLKVGYEGKIIAENINFDVNEGDYLCILGENGSGKSTLMKTLLGLRQPAGGSIVMGNGLKKGQIGYLPQQTEVQKDFPASVKEVVLSGCQARCGFRPFYSRQEKEMALDNMESMGIADLKNQCYRNLSGGQQQRVLLARALCAAGSLLLLDEPVTGLDQASTAYMYSLIEHLNKSHGLGIIMISHDAEEALKYASHILHLGDSIFYGTREEYVSGGFYENYKKSGRREVEHGHIQ